MRTFDVLPHFDDRAEIFKIWDFTVAQFFDSGELFVSYVDDISSTVNS